MVRHDGSEDNTLGPDDCKAHSPWHRRKTQTLSCWFIGYFKRAEFWHRTWYLQSYRVCDRLP